MAAGDVRIGGFSIQRSSAPQTITALIGGTTYFYLRIKAHTPILLGNASSDSGNSNPAFNSHRLEPGEVVELINHSATAGLIDGAKVSLEGYNNDPNPSKVDIFAIDNV